MPALPPPQVHNNVEISHKEFIRQSLEGESNYASSTVRSSMAKRFGNILSTKGLRKNGWSSNGSVASASVTSDNATIEGQQSMEGAQSIAAVTISSHDTIKASNKQSLSPKPPTVHPKKNKRWKTKLKRLVGVKEELSPRAHSKSVDVASSAAASEGYPMRDRVKSADSVVKQSEFDMAIRGRLDGMDILSLGPAGRSCLPGASVSEAKLSSQPHPSVVKTKDGDGSERLTIEASTVDPLHLSFTGMLTTCSPAEMVSEMIWTSAGREIPELILEGFIPGGGDRWCVRLDIDPVVHRSTDRTPVPCDKGDADDDESTAVLTEDGSPVMPMHKLWDEMWGDDQPPPIPSHMDTGNLDDQNEDILELAAKCSVPIDLDEDAFIIDSREHLKSVHNLVMIPLQKRRYDEALSIFSKLLQGLEGPENSKYEHLAGCTHHNIGIVHMCQGDFDQALESFQKAVQVRTECLPQDHPDIAVSLVRQGTAYVALGNFEKAIDSFLTALRMCPTEDATRAKVLNNLGLTYYLQDDHKKALKALTGALEIQRQWLDSPVRREPIVYDASVTLGNMGNIYLRKADFDLAYFVYEEACLLQTTSFRKDHAIVLVSLGNMALAKAKGEDYKEASRIFSSILRSQEAKFGAHNQHTIETVGMLGFIQMKEVKLHDALKSLKTVKNWQERNIPSSHPAKSMTNATIQAVEEVLARDESMWV